MAHPQGAEAPAGELISQLSEQISTLIRSEMRLAQLELKEKGKRAGMGAGLFGAAGALGFLGLAALVATAILALARVLDPWLAALIVAVVVLLMAGIVALVGKREVTQATPAVPEQTVSNLKQDVDTVKERAHR